MFSFFELLIKNRLNFEVNFLFEQDIVTHQCATWCQNQKSGLFIAPGPSCEATTVTLWLQGEEKAKKYRFQMVVLIWWWVPLCESCSSELHWLVVSFEMAAMDPESLFLLYWFRGSICGLPHYCSRFSKSTFCSAHRSVCLGSDVVAQSIEYTLTCSPSSRSCCGIDRFSYPHSYAIYETPTCPRLSSSHSWWQSILNTSPDRWTGAACTWRSAVKLAV